MDSTPLFQEEFKGSNLYAIPPEEPTLQLSANNTALMDMIYGILDRDGPTSPTFPTLIEKNSSKAKVMQWADSLAGYQSPVDTTPPPIYEYDHSLPRSTPSPMGSVFSESSSHDSSSGPKTPTFSNPVSAIIRRKFSYEEVTKILETPTRPPPGPPVLSVPPRDSSHNRTDSSPSPSPIPTMKATITSLVDDFMPEFMPSPVTPVQIKPAKPVNLKISTQPLPPLVTPTSQRPKLEPVPPLLRTFRVDQSISPKSIHNPTPVRNSTSVGESSKKLLKDLEGNFSPIRQSMGFPPNKSMVSKDGPRALNRHSMPSSPNKIVRLDDRLRIQPRRPVLSVVIEERSQAPIVSTSVQSATSKTFDSRDRYRRKNSVTASPITKNMITEDHLRIQVRHSMIPPPSKPLRINQQKPAPIRHSLPAPARRTQQEIEAIPAPEQAKSEGPGSFRTNLRLWSTKGFFAGEQGMQFTMSRRVITMSKMEWTVEGVDGSRLLKCFEQTQSLSRRKDFLDPEGNQLFDFQRSTGSTRTAESPKGATLFTIKNALLHTTPHWTVSLTGTTDNAAAQWVAKGDEAMENVIVTWGGFQVGRISCESGLKKHTYTVNIAPEMNYCIIAALTTVFDDLRTDEGC